jgi:release factor glutamine methyltransferase
LSSRFDANPGETRAAALARLAAHLELAGVEAGKDDARALLIAAAGLTRAELMLDPDAPLGSEAASRLAGYADRRAAREPVTRILGARGFWTLDLLVAPDVLDPRPDSETVVEFALDLLCDRRHAPLRILDLGSGSGAILCALLAEAPAAWGVAVDLSSAACAATHANLVRAGLSDRAAVLRGRWGDALNARFDLVVSNPPYIPGDDIEGLTPEVRLHDPCLALDGGVDGLDCYREILSAVPRLLAENGSAIFEVGAGQADGLEALAAAAGFERLGRRRDAGGHDRAVALGPRRGPLWQN